MSVWIHIGRRRAIPTRCPACGHTTAKPFPMPKSMLEMMHNWSHRNRVVQQEVEGWPGYTTWYFQCDCRHFLEGIDLNKKPAWMPERGSYSWSIPIPLPIK